MIPRFVRQIALPLAALALLLAACDDNARDGTRRFCNGVASVERSLERVDALDRRSSGADAESAHSGLQDAYHDFIEGHTALQIFGPRTINIDAIAADIEALMRQIRITADGEPIANQLSEIQRLSGAVADGAVEMNEEAGC